MTHSRATIALEILALALCANVVCGQPPSIATKPAGAEDSVENKTLKNVQQLTFDFAKAGEGYFSPDGRTIIYQAEPRDYMFYQIFTQPLIDRVSGSRPPAATRVSPGRGRTTCSFFAPDGKSILFASSHLDPKLDETEAAEQKQREEDRNAGRRRRYQWDFDPWMDIFTSDLQGGNLQQLTNEPGYDAEGAYTPDGKQIVFCSDRDGDPDLYVMDADGSNVRQLTNEPGYDGGPFTSPDGRWVVYRTDRKQKDHLQIHVIGIDGQNDVALTLSLIHI